jgi:glycosyltransferase involved in cell wall biosynthesis
MRIMVYPHAMEIGGSQLNALALAGAVSDLGHEVVVFSHPGVLGQRVRELGLEHVEIPADRRRPSVATSLELAREVRRRRVDIVHGYEWPPAIEACFGPGLLCQTAVIGTVLSMSVVPFFPRTIPLVVGSEVIRDAALGAGQQRVALIEPPVDTEADHPRCDGRRFRDRHGVSPDDVLIAMVCRLVPELKLTGLLASCDAVGELAQRGHQVRLIIVGDGQARETVAQRAALANQAAGREVVTLTGEARDPREAYAAADILVGQGGSALRGMAFGKPLVVAGEEGFSELVTPSSSPLFLRQGWYGLGPGSLGSGVPALRDALLPLVISADLRAELGAYVRQLVEDRFSLRRAAEDLETEYALAVDGSHFDARVIADLARSGLGVLATKARSRYQRRRGMLAVDDANSRPLTAAASPVRT